MITTREEAEKLLSRKIAFDCGETVNLLSVDEADEMAGSVITLHDGPGDVLAVIVLWGIVIFFFHPLFGDHK